MTTVASTAPSLVDVLQVIGAFLIGAPLGVLGGWIYLRLVTPAGAGDRAPRRGRIPLPAGISPEPAGSMLAAPPETSRGRHAAETPLPDGVSAAPGGES